MEDTIFKYVKDLGIPLTTLVIMLYFFVARYVPSQLKRDQEKDERIGKQINELIARQEVQLQAIAEKHNKTILQVSEDNTRSNERILGQAMDMLKMTHEHNKMILDSITNHSTALSKSLSEKIDSILTSVRGTK